MASEYTDLTHQYAAKPVGYYEMERAEILPLVPKTSRLILDVGCSSGAFGAALKREIGGCEVWGIEPVKSASDVASTRLDHVINGTITSAASELEGKCFDAICFNDVLEHMAKPEEALHIAKDLLSDKGVVVASIPNILHFYQIWEILTQQDWRYQDAGILDNTHLRFFTRKSIIRLFESCGFTVEVIKGVNPSYGVKYKVANAITLGKLADWKYIQFGVTARPVERS
jgi:2-polyprenyl-3-methyl-5-hydroxy-6-metoxy-1,4-benzoquinol methylase